MSLMERQYLIRSTFKPEAEVDPTRYPFNIPAVMALQDLRFHPKVTFFVGETGSLFDLTKYLPMLIRRCHSKDSVPTFWRPVDINCD